MPDVNKPMAVPELYLRPPIDGKVRLSEDMQQTLALLAGYGDNARKLLKASESGILYTTNPRIKDVCDVESDGVGSHVQGLNIPCNEIMIMGHPDNDTKVWVRPYSKPIVTESVVSNAWPIAANSVVGFTVSNLNQLWFYFVGETDKVIVAYSI